MRCWNNDLIALRSRLQQLNWIEEQFNNSPLKKKSTLTAPELLKLTDEGEQILQYIQELEINENEHEKNKRIEEDAKNKKSKKEMSFQKQQQPQDQGSRLMMFYPSRRNIDPDLIGGTTHRVVPDLTSCFARIANHPLKRMSKTLPR
jgi:pyruvate carboxylase